MSVEAILEEEDESNLKSKEGCAMRKHLTFLTAVVTLLLACGGAAASSPMDLLDWQVYDSFPGPALNTALWDLSNPRNNYVGYTVSNGLTVSTSSDKPKLSLGVTYPITNVITSGGLFAAKVPFNVSASVQSGGAVAVGMDLGGNTLVAPLMDRVAIPITWVWAENYQGFNGKLFVSGPDGNPVIVPTDVTHGELGLIYDGTTLSTFYNEGSGWQMLYSGNPGWHYSSVDPLESGLNGGDIKGVSGTSMAATFADFEIATSFLPVPSVPEPATIFLLGSGLLGLCGIRLSFRK
jgi:hypothetical protein